MLDLATGDGDGAAASATVRPASRTGEAALRPPRQTAAGPGGVFRLPARAGIYAPGQPLPPTFDILSGAVMSARLLPDGRRQIVDIVGAGRMIGPAVAPVEGLTIETLTATTLRPAFWSDAETGLARVAGELRVALRRTEAHLLLLGRKSALERVASGLSELALLLAEPQPGRPDAELSFRLPLTRADLADWLGLVLETVSRNLSCLQRAGVIAIERQEIIHVLDLSALRATAALNSG